LASSSAAWNELPRLPEARPSPNWRPLDLDSHAFQAGHDVERDQRFILDNQKSLALERLGRRGLLNTPQAGGRRLDGIATPFRDDGGVRRQRRDLALPAISRARRR
jgi:hypothetical protein